ncbi:MAG: caspase family protein [Limisphaerales bacterium]
MPVPLKLLCVHGVGHQEVSPAFREGWQQAIATGLAGLVLAGEPVTPEVVFFEYDALFAERPADLALWQTAFRRLLESGLRSALERGGAPTGARTVPGAPRGIFDWFEAGHEALQWTAGMIAQWAADPVLRARVRKKLAADIQRHRPSAVIAHSLGSLVAYDLLARPATAALGAERVLITLGSQINNPFVRDLFGGRVRELATRHWFHLFNPHDNAFTAPIRTPLPRFTQVDAAFNLPGFLDHDAVEYLRHGAVRRAIWSFLSERSVPPSVAAARFLPAPAAASPRRRRDLPATPAVNSLGDAIAFTIGETRQRPARRALLVGINEYPDPRMELEGCVNDVYLMSELLQEQGFAAEDIRIVLNDRATAAAIRERLQWLLEDCQDGFDRVLYYSGHGAQISSYGLGETVDAVDECLVPWDFDWTLERAVTDDWFHDCYSQLPPEASFLAIFDCCHSGGLARDGGPRVRGINPPDDLRHRLLRWDDAAGVWQSRTADEERAPARRGRLPAAKARPAAGLHLRRLGRGMRDVDAAANALRARPAEFGLGPAQGAYMPIMLQACQEGQKAFEYRHGSTPHGAFTFSLVRALRRRAGRKYTWGRLIEDVGGQINRLGYRDQNPGQEGPAGFERDPIPWAQSSSLRR